MTDFARRARAPVRPTARPDDHDPTGSPDGRPDDTDLAKERFRRAAANGDFAGLLDASLWTLFAEAAAQRGFATEIGALRFALTRLVAEESDPRHLATHLARVTTTILRAADAQERAQAEPEDPVAVALTRVLTDLSDLSDRPDATTPLAAPATRPRRERTQERDHAHEFEQDPDPDDPDADGDWPGDDL